MMWQRSSASRCKQHIQPIRALLKTFALTVIPGDIAFGSLPAWAPSFQTLSHNQRAVKKGQASSKSDDHREPCRGGSVIPGCLCTDIDSPGDRNGDHLDRPGAHRT